MSGEFYKGSAERTIRNYIGTTEKADGETASGVGTTEYTADTDGTITLVGGSNEVPVDGIIDIAKTGKAGILTVNPPPTRNIGSKTSLKIPARGGRSLLRKDTNTYEDLSLGWRPLPPVADGTIVDSGGVLANGLASDITVSADGYQYTVDTKASTLRTSPSGEPGVLIEWDIDWFVYDYANGSYGDMQSMPTGLEVMIKVQGSSGWPDWLAAGIGVDPMNAIGYFHNGGSNLFVPSWYYGPGATGFYNVSGTTWADTTDSYASGQIRWIRATNTTIRCASCSEYAGGSQVVTATQGRADADTLSNMSLAIFLQHSENTLTAGALGTGNAIFSVAWRPIPRPTTPF